MSDEKTLEDAESCKQTDLAASLDAANDRVDVLKDENNFLREQLHAVQGEMDTARERAKKAEGEVQGKDTYAAGLLSEVSRRDIEVEKLKTLIGDARRDAERLWACVDAWDAMVIDYMDAGISGDRWKVEEVKGRLEEARKALKARRLDLLERALGIGANAAGGIVFGVDESADGDASSAAVTVFKPVYAIIVCVCGEKLPLTGEIDRICPKCGERWSLVPDGVGGAAWVHGSDVPVTDAPPR